MVDFRNAYWHPVEESDKVDGLALLKLVGETARVADMYGMSTKRMKFQSRDSAIFIVSSGKALLCGLFAAVEGDDESEIWSSLEQSIELMKEVVGEAVES